MKKIAIFMILLSVSTIIMGIGYAAIDNVTLELSGNTSVKKIDNVRITKVEYKSDLLANKEESKINHFNKTTINSKIVLGDDIDSTISYEVTLRNDTDSTYKYVGAVNDNSKEFYDNDNIGYEVSGIDNNELLQPDTEKVVTLTFKYKSEPIDNQILNSYINIKFIKIYNIEYVNIDSNDLTEYPYDTNGNKYTPVEYLESTGTQYIDTGYGNSNGSKFNYVATYVSDYGYIVGSHNTTEPYGRQGGYYRSNNIWELGYGGCPQAKFETQHNKKYEVEFSTIKGNAYLKVDGNILISNTSNQTLTSYNYLVFYNQYRLYVTHVPTTQAKIYMLQIMDNDGVLIRDYIPVIDSTSRPCLFDKVEKKCYYNQGTGEFLWG